MTETLQYAYAPGTHTAHLTTATIDQLCLRETSALCGCVIAEDWRVSARKPSSRRKCRRCTRALRTLNNILTHGGTHA